MALAIRLSFAYEVDKFVLTRATRIKMRVLPATEIENFDDCSGVWIQVTSSTGKPLYRRVISRIPFEDDVRVQTGDPVTPFSRQRPLKKIATFHAVIPDLDDAQTFTVKQRLFDKAGQASTNVHAEIDLKKLSFDNGGS